MISACSAFAAKVTVPLGNAAPKSAASAGGAPVPLTFHATLLLPVVTPLRLSVNTNAVVPLSPSASAALVASGCTIPMAVSSLRIVPDAVPAPASEAPLSPSRLTTNPSSNSTCASPFTFTLIVLLTSFAPNDTVPLGSVPDAKSVASAGLSPEPTTAHFAVLDPLSTPVRLTVNRYAVVAPLAPSALSAEVAAIDRFVSSLRIVPLALAAVITPLVGADSVTANPSSPSAV